MKVIVAEAFFDKTTGEPYNRGDIFDSTNKTRIKELRDAGYLAAEAFVEEKPAAQNSETPDGADGSGGETGDKANAPD